MNLSAAKTLAATTLAALLFSLFAGTWVVAAPSSAAPQAQQPPAAAQLAKTPSTVCEKNKQAAAPDQTIKRWCDQRDAYTIEDTNLQNRIEEFSKSLATVIGISSSGPAFNLQKAYIDSVSAQKADLDAIIDKLQEIIDVYAILPYLGDQKVGAAQQLAGLQVDLSAEIAKYQSDKRATVIAVAVKPQPANNSNTDTAQPKQVPRQAKSQNQDPPPAQVQDQGKAQAPANADPGQAQPAPGQNQDPAPAAGQNQTPAPPAVKKTTPWGPLAGQVLEEKTASPIANAIVVAQCGADGSNKITTWTDVSGQYFFTSLPDQPCLIRAAKTLSQEEFDVAQADFATWLANAANVKGLGTRQAETKAIGALPPKDWAYEERSLTSVGPGAQTAGQPVVASDLFLSRRTSTVGEFARTIVGFQQSGTTSADSLQRFFFDLWLSIPAPFLNDSSLRLTPRKLQDPNFGPRYRLWGDIRVTSVPQQITNSVGEFALGFAANVASLKVNQVAQGAEFMAGGEVRIGQLGVTNSRFLSFDNSARERFGVYLTAGGGASTPISPANPVQIFNNPTLGSNPAFDNLIAGLGLTSKLAGKPFVAFSYADRNRFQKEYYAGLRLKTYYYDRDTDEPVTRFPATLDILAGQNQAITGGRFHRPVLRMEGFYPLPYDALHSIYLFGTADLILGGPLASNPILLQQASSPPMVPDPSVLLIPTDSQLSRDRYNIGVGIDFLQLWSTIANANKNKPKGNPSPTAASNGNQPAAAGASNNQGADSSAND